MILDQIGAKYGHERGDLTKLPIITGLPLSTLQQFDSFEIDVKNDVNFKNSLVRYSHFECVDCSVFEILISVYLLIPFYLQSSKFTDSLTF